MGVFAGRFIGERLGNSRITDIKRETSEMSEFFIMSAVISLVTAFVYMLALVTSVALRFHKQMDELETRVKLLTRAVNPALQDHEFYAQAAAHWMKSKAR
jgi:hypothetical protein